MIGDKMERVKRLAITLLVTAATMLVVATPAVITIAMSPAEMTTLIVVAIAVGVGFYLTLWEE